MIINFLKQKISKPLFYSFLIQGVYTVISPVSMILLARLLGPNEFGLFAFALSIITILSMISQLGLPIVITRYGAIYYLKSKFNLLKGIISFSNRKIITFSFLITFGLVLSCLLEFIEEQYQLTVLMSSPLILLFSLSKIRSSVLTAINKVNLAQIPEMIVRPTMMIIFVLLLFHLKLLTIKTALVLYVAINIVTYLYGEYLVKKHTNKLTTVTKKAFEKSKWLKSAAPLFLLGGIQTLGAQADVFILGLFGDSADAGVFKSMYQIALLVIFSLSAVNAISAPLIVRSFENKDNKGLKRLLKNFCGINFILSIVISLPLFFFSEYIISLIYGQEYVIGVRCLQILIIGRIINTTLGVSNQFLKMMGEERQATFGILLGTVLGIFLNIFLIPKYGINGAAIASSIGLVIWNVYLFSILLKKLSLT